MLFVTVRLFLDPEGAITYNGVPTTDPELKRNIVLFVLVFPAVGVILALLPKHLYRKLLCWQLKMNPFSR